MRVAPDDLPRDPADLARRIQAHPAARIELPDPARAAVALVFTPALDLLFIRRSERAGDPWSGHMALPGGRVEAGDADTRAAALRETREEVGVDLGPARYVGPIDELSSPVRKGRRRLVVSPHVWLLPAPVATQPNGEVARVYWFGVDRLIRGEGRGVMSWSWQGRDIPMPVVRLGDADIWGITLRIVDDLVTRLKRGR